MGGTRMSDHKQNNADDSEFDRELAVTSRAYKGAEADLPPPAMDDAIRAAARRAVKSQPHAMGKSWIARYSVPLSAAALVMLTVSVGFIALDERPELAPASLSESVKPKVASSASPAMPMDTPESPPSAAAQAPRLSQPALVAEKKPPIANPNIALRDPLAESPKPALERPRNDDRAAASGAIRPTESNVAVANDRPVLAASPLPAAPLPAVKDTQAFVADPGATAETMKREAVKEKPLMTQVAPEKRSDAAPGGKQGSLVAPAATTLQAVEGVSAVTAPAASITRAPVPTPAAKANEPPDVWMKHILELKQQGKAREFEEELAKFRKRYPEFVLPEELKVRH